MPVLQVAHENDVFTYIERLKNSQHARRRHREFFVEGVKSIDRARRHRWPIRSLVYAARRRLTAWARDTLAGTPEARHIEVSAPLMERLSDKHHVSEIIATVAMPDDSTERIRSRAAALVVVMDRPSSPGNLGSVIRSCHGFGADGLIVTGQGTDIYNPLTVRASMGSLFALPVVRLASHKDVGQWVDDVGASRSGGGGAGRMQIVGTSVDGAMPVDSIDLTRGSVLVLGNEAAGLGAGYGQLCDVVVQIPMRGEADSINVACAAAVVLYEVDRQRRRQREERTAEPP